MLREAIEGPAVWYGDELFERPDWLMELSNAEVHELEAAARRAPDALPSMGPAAFELPTLGHRLKKVQHNLEHGSGAVLIRGLPIETRSIEQIERIFWGLVVHLGTPISQTASGDRMFHVRDEGFPSDDPRARGPNTRKRLSFHTDRCDVIAFLCLQQAIHGGDNHIVSSATLYNEIRKRRPELVAELMRPYYYKRHTVDLGNDLAYCRQPIFSFCEGHFAASFLRVLIDRASADPQVPDISERQREAIDYLEEVADDPTLYAGFRQQPGDLLLLNNWVTLHRRTEFADHPDPRRKRHILRVWLSVPNSRPIDPLFRDNYGATEAGALRGGMRPRNDPRG